jgi:hypothetical protein
VAIVYAQLPAMNVKVSGTAVKDASSRQDADPATTLTLSAALDCGVKQPNNLKKLCCISSGNPRVHIVGQSAA